MPDLLHSIHMQLRASEQTESERLKSCAESLELALIQEREAHRKQLQEVSRQATLTRMVNNLFDPPFSVHLLFYSIKSLMGLLVR